MEVWGRTEYRIKFPWRGETHAGGLVTNPVGDMGNKVPQQLTIF